MPTVAADGIVVDDERIRSRRHTGLITDEFFPSGGVSILPQSEAAPMPFLCVCRLTALAHIPLPCAACCKRSCAESLPAQK